MAFPLLDVQPTPFFKDHFAMKLERVFRAFLTVSFAIVAMNLTAPASQADSPPPMGISVLGGSGNTVIITTHYSENKVNMSVVNSDDNLSESYNFSTGNGPIAATFDLNDNGSVYTANFLDSTVTKNYYNSISELLETCTVAIGSNNESGLNPLAITPYQNGVITANVGDNSISFLEFDNACEITDRVTVTSDSGPVAVTPIDGGVFVLNYLSQTIQYFDSMLDMPTTAFDLGYDNFDWPEQLTDDLEEENTFVIPVAMQIYSPEGPLGIAVLFDEISNEIKVRQHIQYIPFTSDAPIYFGPFDNPRWDIPASQRFVMMLDSICLITSSTTIECINLQDLSSLTITTSAGISALATDWEGNFYAANSRTKEVTRFNLDWPEDDWSVDKVFQISLTEPSSNSNQENSTSTPSAPTSVVAKTTGKRSATVSFSPPANNGGSVITSYSATSTPGGITKILTQANGGTFTFDNLQPGTAYTFAVTATNAIGTSASTISNSIKTMPLEVASISALTFVDDGTGTGGKIVWSGKGIDSVLYTGPENSYPGPYNYGAFSSGWNGRIRNLEPDKSYTISIFAVSADGVGESKSLTFKTSAALPALAGSVNTLSTSSSSARSTSTELAPVLKWIEENTFVPGEGAKMSGLLTKFDALVTSPHRAYIKVPTSRVSTVTATSLTPKACSVVSASAKADAGLVTALSGDKCTISYTVTGGSKAPATLVKDFIFKKFVK